MTTYGDVLQSGLTALTSGLSSISPVQYCRTFRFTNTAAQTQSFVLPVGVQNLDAKLYIIQDGSAATTDTLTVSAGGTTLITFSSFGSAAGDGVIRNTTAGLGTLTVNASGAANLSATAEVTAAATLASTDVATDYQLVLMFSLLRDTDI